MAKKLKTLVFAAALVLPALAAGAGRAAESSKGGHRDVLFRIAAYCLNPNPPDIADYCRQCPSPLPSLFDQCDAGFSQEDDPAAVCRKTTDVWAETPAFVAIRDRKMCGCGDGSFVHGLAIPRTKVTGVEDAQNLPKGIWQFAWNAARRKISDEGQIALIANPSGRRTQDQLHIHLVRLAQGAREQFTAFDPVPLKSLADAWAAARTSAEDKGLAPDAYGIAVILDPSGGGYQLAVVPESAGDTETLLSVSRCP